MLSQLSSASPKIAAFRYDRPKGSMIVNLAAIAGAIMFALFVVQGVHGLTQAFAMA
jgi:hypothetical protein